MRYLEQEKKYVIAKQLLRSGTSIGANIFEAQNAESKADFIHKMKIAAKETSETHILADIMRKKQNIINLSANSKDQLDEIIRILSKIISSSKTGVKWHSLSGCNGIFKFSNFQIFKLT